MFICVEIASEYFRAVVEGIKDTVDLQFKILVSGA